MLLEIITGRRPIDKAQHYLDDNIVDWVSLFCEWCNNLVQLDVVQIFCVQVLALLSFPNAHE